jgi:glycosyltransferase involved in cell wall biosynthesis
VTDPLRIALISPHGWPPRDDVAHHVAEEAAALAARGHRVTILAPATSRERIAAGRGRLRAAGSGDPSALIAAAGEVREVAVGRALPAGPGRRLGGPIDLATALEIALSAAPFDVVHLHEPLAPSPALAALRHARGVSAVTFHRAEPLAGVAFLRPLVDRALARADLRIATSRAGVRALEQVLPGDYAVVAPGVDLARFRAPVPAPDGPPGLVLVARGRDRTGLRFVLGMLRGLDLAAVGPVTLIGPPDAPWRTRAAVPKRLREAVAVVPDGGPATRADALAAGAVVVLATAEDAAGPVLREAMACGRAIVVPRCPAIEEAARHGVEALALPPFSREAWTAAVAELASDGRRRAELGAGAAAAGRARGWGDVASDLEAAYAEAISSGSRSASAGSPARVAADLRVRPGPGLDPSQIVAACRERGIGIVAVAAPEGLGPAHEVARLAPADLAVVVGQEIATSDGALVGLFLAREVPAGLDPADAAAAVRAQGGIVVVPHPDGEPAPPSPAAMRRLAGAIDCNELVRAGPGDGAGEEAARLALRLGVLGSAASGAARPADVGGALTEIRPFHGPADFLDALADARLVRPPRRRGARDARPRGRGARRPES